MSSPVRRITDKLNRDHPEARRGRPNNTHEKVRSLKLMVMKLQAELDKLGEVTLPDIASGIDFYDEVAHFESGLIKRAMILMRGNQLKAAKLLNLNATTLNAKVKYYRIKLGHHDDPAEERRDTGG
jgi:DNA-binding NtrC family response regulator